MPVFMVGGSQVWWHAGKHENERYCAAGDRAWQAWNVRRAEFAGNDPFADFA
jgi:hypothetical protein